jgi:hypothetical protein
VSPQLPLVLNCEPLDGVLLDQPQPKGDAFVTEVEVEAVVEVRLATPRIHYHGAWAELEYRNSWVNL